MLSEVWSAIKGNFADLCKTVTEQVLLAEKNMKGKTGKEKRKYVTEIVDKLIPLPWFLEWADGPVIGWVIDLACEKLNWLTDYNFEDTKLTDEQVTEIANSLTAPINGVVSIASASDNVSLDDKISQLYDKYGIKPSEPVKESEQPKTEEKKEEPAPVIQKEEPKKVDAVASTSDANSNWEKSIAFSLKYEGGLNFTVVNGKPVIKASAKADKGGATAYGITIPVLKTAYAQGVVSHQDICKLTQAEAKLIYKKNFWDRYGWGEIGWGACLCCLDCCINHGKFALILQRAANDCGQSCTVDGKFGPQTFKAIKASDPKKFAKAVVARRKKYYEDIVKNNPSQKVFLKGWLARNDAMAKASGAA